MTESILKKPQTMKSNSNHYNEMNQRRDPFFRNQRVVPMTPTGNYL